MPVSLHVERVWRNDEKILIFLLLGNKRLAQLLAQWLYHHHEHRGVVEDAPEFSWPTQSETVQLENYDMTGLPVTVGARDCIQWLLQNADAYKMIDDVFFIISTRVIPKRDHPSRFNTPWEENEVIARKLSPAPLRDNSEHHT